MLEPQELLVITIDPPFTANEQPVALTPNPGDVLLRDATPTSVTITNPTDRTVAYLLVAVPKSVMRMATMPWKQIAADLGQAVQDNGVLNSVARTLSLFAHSRSKK